MNINKFRRGPAIKRLGGISVIFPVHNESFIIEQTLRNYVSELGSRVDDIEFIVYEDGSTDDTKAVLERLADELPIRLYTNDLRQGYLQALKSVMACASKPWLFIVDSDYQFAAIDFWKLERLREENDIIIGVKAPRRDPFYRIFLAWGYNMLLRWFFKINYKDLDSGFRLYRKSVVDRISPNVCYMSFFNAEFVIRAHFKKFRIAQIPVQHYARKIGSTQIFYISNLFFICIQQFIGIIRLWIELKNHHSEDLFLRKYNFNISRNISTLNSKIIKLVKFLGKR